MHKYAAVALVGLLALGLTGCGDDETTDAQDVQARGFANVQQDAPLAADTTAPEGDEAETIYLEEVRKNLPPTTVIRNASDEALIATGWDVCARLEAGENLSTVSLIEGEPLGDGGYYFDSSNVITRAHTVLCPDAPDTSQN